MPDVVQQEQLRFGFTVKLQYIQTGTNKARLKQVAKNFLLVVGDVDDMSVMQSFLQRMHAAVIRQPAQIEM